MPTLGELPLELMLYDNPLKGGALVNNVKDAIGPTWKRSIRANGGFWLGTATYEGNDFEKLELFVSGMFYQLRELLGSVVTWEGFLGTMKLTLNGITYVRDLMDTYNAVKTTYSRVGDNLLTNGSGESSLWADLDAGGPNELATRERVTTWSPHGIYSHHLVADAADQGVYIQATFAIVANKAYDFRCSIDLISGTWRFGVYQAGTSTVVASSSEGTVGQRVWSSVISDTNLYAGNVDLVIFCESPSGEIYVDDASMYESPVSSQTSWYMDEDSQDEYGRIDEVLLEAGMSDEAAINLTQTYLAEHAWPRTQLDTDDIIPLTPLEETERPKLELIFYGWIWTSRNRVTDFDGTDAASDQVTALLDLCDFLTPGTVTENTMEFSIDNRGSYRVWEVLRDIADAGDSTGNRWLLEVLADRIANYLPADQEVKYYYRNGYLHDLSSGDVEPWLAAPGVIRLEDLPRGPEPLTGLVLDDPRHVYIEEVEFSVDDWLAGRSSLTFRRQVS